MLLISKKVIMHHIMEGLMSLKELVPELRKMSSTILVGILAVLITSAFVGGKSVDNINEIINVRVDARVDARIESSIIPRLESIDSKLNYLVESSYEEILLLLNKQIEKMNSDPKDIKRVDIERIMRAWMILPSNYKTDDVVYKYDKLKAWYETK